MRPSLYKLLHVSRGCRGWLGLESCQFMASTMEACSVEPSLATQTGCKQVIPCSFAGFIHIEIAALAIHQSLQRGALAGQADGLQAGDAMLICALHSP